MKKILFACASGLPNSGDEALLRAMLMQMNGRAIHPMALSFDAEFTRRFHGIDAYSLSSHKEIVNAVRKSDMVVLGGGGLIQDETTVYNPYRWLKFLKVATQYSKPCIVYGNSIGPLKYSINKYLAKKYLSRAAHVIVRDNSSYSLLQELGVKVPITSAFDPVFSFKRPDEAKSDAVMHQYSIAPKFIFVSLRHWFDTHPLIPVKIATQFNIKSKFQQASYDSFITSMQKCCNELIRRYGSQIVFHAFRAGKDSLVARHVSEGIHGDCRILDDPQMKPEVVMSLMKRARLTVGMRLHSLIYSIVAQTPFVALSYSQKVDGMLAGGGLESLAVPVSNVTIEGFSQVLNHIENNLDQVLEKMNAYYMKAHTSERENMSKIFDLIDNN
ncbi:hypothetical protein GO013_12530 [Pseudodesulfovibrio sp. JC047]|uniref:polysaccharide pyruvyl transferase family protein n=1 Tax=Pseudodesulfovibrio sp. JC047 TaxID=2683199 RepID=UPI0013D8AEFF|nr:polysaccharide pyruvyl transferase family protein [Pseudodesulfovibrio sp. JC047]NDV20237.1 hypothetical protein [Pseudodesulfovibrio sp. JC047]